METKKKKREWIKTAAIIFLTILLVLTFFSQTIMNHSLPEVSVQSVESGTIHTRIRMNGSVSANETYQVSINQTRKVHSVKVRVGDTVQEGDILFTLEPTESMELKAAQELLAQMEQNYQKRLTEVANSAAQQDRQLQKLREEYYEASRIYQLYSTIDPSQLEYNIRTEEVKLNSLSEELAEAKLQLSEAEYEAGVYSEAVENLKTELESVQNAFDRLWVEADYEKMEHEQLQDRISVLKGLLAEADYDSRSADLEQKKIDLVKRQGDASTFTNLEGYTYTNQELFEFFEKYTNIIGYDVELLRKQCLADSSYFLRILRSQMEDPSAATEEFAEALCKSYTLLCEQLLLVETAQQRCDEVLMWKKEKAFLMDAYDLSLQLNSVKTNLRSVQVAYENSEFYLARLRAGVDSAQKAVEAQQAVLTSYEVASGAASALEMAETALEDRLFELSLQDTSDMDLEAEKQAIEEQKELVETLTANADEQEITAPVGGLISELAINAGGTADAESPLVTLTLTDRGYTVRVPVTTEQARQVRIGDTAEISNYYFGNITATLENIANDPQSMGQNKILIFRLTGDVEPGTNLTLSIGQRSAQYDAIIPNSAIRTDSNGTYVLIVTAKSSPLGNRYLATRAAIEVLAADDTRSAVKGVANGDFVITTSTAPISAGDQVSMVDNG